MKKVLFLGGRERGGKRRQRGEEGGREGVFVCVGEGGWGVGHYCRDFTPTISFC